MLSCDSFGPRSESPNQGGDPNPCDGNTESVPLSWDEESELGTASQAFDGLEGQCQGALHWNSDSDLADVNVDGNVSMSVEVTLEKASARLVRARSRDQRGPSISCPSELQVDAKVELHSDDGRISVKANTKARFRAGSTTTLAFPLAKNDQRGSLILRERKGETIALNFELDGAGANCAGDVMVTTTSVGAGGTGRGEAGRIASWSASGCPTGQAPFDLEQDVGGNTLPQLITETWNGKKFDGIWSDGSSATLSLHVELLAGATACAEPRAESVTVTLPVEARYSTDDGRIEQRAAAANVRAELLTQTGDVDNLSLWISDELPCESTESRLAYTQGDCTKLKAATVQLGLTSASGSESVPSDGGLSVYFLPRFGELPKPDKLSLR
jgi:hypothetical protein